MLFRIAINVGDVMVKHGDIFGDGVNVPAGLQTLARAGALTRAIGNRQSSFTILQSISTSICVLRNLLKTPRRGFDDSSSPSASLASRDILFPELGATRKAAEWAPSRPFFRTMSTGLEAHFRPFFDSLSPPSLTQPNHARFGTDVRNSRIQRVRGHPRRCEFEGCPQAG
jgi:hypothetical protein